MTNDEFAEIWEKIMNQLFAYLKPVYKNQCKKSKDGLSIIVNDIYITVYQVNDWIEITVRRSSEKGVKLMMIRYEEQQDMKQIIWSIQGLITNEETKNRSNK